MSGYRALGQFYDRLMARETDASARADYLLSLFEKHSGRRPTTMLDLACGAGRVTRELALRGADMIGVDGSEEMLSMAAEVCRGLCPPVLLLCQDMRALDLNDTVEGAVCVFDGLNHLCRTRDIAAVLARLRLFVAPGGWFIFDVNTPYKHRELLGDRDFVWEQEGLLCLWRNTLLPRTCEVSMELDFFEEQSDGRYERQSDTVRERAYTLSTWKRLFTENGWELHGVYEDMTAKPPCDTTERWVLAAQNTRPETDYR